MKLVLPMALLAAGLSVGANAKADDNDGPGLAHDLTCESVPAGYEIKTYLNGTSLTNGKVDILTVGADGTLQLIDTFPAVKDINTGDATELKDDWSAPGFTLSYDLVLDVSDPTGAGAQTSAFTYTGDGLDLHLGLDCY